MYTAIEELQRETCKRFNVQYCPSPLISKVGIAKNVKTNILPVNGMRHPPVGDTTGWYIWAGEHLSKAPDFFVPLHVSHLDEWRPELKKYLGLPPGWRFLVANKYEDVWFDENLLHI
ncbi:MAG: hypothetical protein ABL936_09045 [Aestuariivirga sp.]